MLLLASLESALGFEPRPFPNNGNVRTNYTLQIIHSTKVSYSLVYFHEKHSQRDSNPCGRNENPVS